MAISVKVFVVHIPLKMLGKTSESMQIQGEMATWTKGESFV